MPSSNRIMSSDGHIPILDDIYDESSTQKCPLGTRQMWADGRVYKYAKNADVALASGGQLLQAYPTPNGWDTSVQPAATYAVGTKVIGCSATAGTSVLGINTSLDAVVDGFIGVRTGSGSGHQYQIKSQTSISSNSAFTLTLYDPLKVALAATSTCAVTRNPYKDLIVSPTTATGAIVGVSPMAVTASYYIWVQTWGIGLGRCQLGVAVAGNAVTRSVGTVGAVVQLSSAVSMNAPLGQAHSVGIVGSYGTIFWTISP